MTLGPAWWNFASAGKNQLLGWWFGEFQSLTSTPEGFTTVTPQGEALEGPKVRLSGPTGAVVSDVSVR